MSTESAVEETRRRLPDLIRTIEGTQRLLILTHDNPDPDSLASAFALKYLARRYCHNPATVAYGGIIGRAENHTLIRECHLNPHHLCDIKWASYDGLALVDHQPRRGMIRWPDNIWPRIIIDHHPRRRLQHPVAYVDVRKGFGSNAALIYDYIQEVGLSIPRFLATALLCGIRSDTQEMSRGGTENDLRAYLALFPLSDHRKVQRIQNPAISPEYIQNFWHGIREARLWEDIITTYAGDVIVPDLISEIADRMVKIEGVKWSMVSGYHDTVLYVSVRGLDNRRDVGRLIRKVVGRKGSAGGHGFMAGAQVRDVADSVEAESLSKQFFKKYVDLLHPGTEITNNPVTLFQME